MKTTVLLLFSFVSQVVAVELLEGTIVDPSALNVAEADSNFSNNTNGRTREVDDNDKTSGGSRAE